LFISFLNSVFSATGFHVIYPDLANDLESEDVPSLTVPTDTHSAPFQY
jgi:hypothetical protein